MEDNAKYAVPVPESERLISMGMKIQKEIDDLKRPEFVKMDGETYIITGEQCDKVIPDEIIKPEPFATYTLDGLIDYIRANVDGYFNDPGHTYLVRVTSPTQVEVISPTIGYYNERVKAAACSAMVPKIDFGVYMDQERFQIMVQTCFEESENRAKVLQLVGNLKKEQNMQVADDGVSQKVTVNAGVVKAADVIVRNPVTLVPFRTFREVEQPESPFVLRVDENANAALFTGDGSAWKLEAVARVGEYLRKNLEGTNVIVIA